MRKENAWRNLAAIQSGVAWFAPCPGKTPMPLYASVCIASIPPTNRKEIPTTIK